MRVVLALLLLMGTPGYGAPPVKIYPGFVSKLRCEGRLYVSAIGNDRLVQLDALPKEMGCAVLLKTLAGEGQTNLVLETSTGTILRIVEIVPSVIPSSGLLEIQLRAEGSP